MRRLRNMWQWATAVLGMLMATVPASAVPLYSIHADTDELVRVDTVTGSVTVVGTIGQDWTDGVGDLTYSDGLLYAVTGGYSCCAELVAIDPASGGKMWSVNLFVNGQCPAFVEGLTTVAGGLVIGFSFIPVPTSFSSNQLGDLSLTGYITNVNDYSPMLADFDGLGVNPLTTQVIGTDSRPGDNQQATYSVDRDPPVYTLVGLFSSANGGGDDIEFLPGGSLFGIDASNNRLTQIDPQTGALIGSLPLNPSLELRGLAYIGFCGDGTCDPGEDSCTCLDDCGQPDVDEVPGVTCDDGLDNDCDTLVDCADPDCQPCCGDVNCDPGEDSCNCSSDCGGDPSIRDTEVEVIASDASGDDAFGSSVSISADTAVVSGWLNDDAGDGSGSAYIFQRDLGGVGNWGEAIKLTAADAQAADNFGVSVSISGATAILGASGSDGAGSVSGSAYVFARNMGGLNNWGEVAKLTASDAAAIDQFGISVSISGDTAIVGAFGNSDSGSASGSAYIVERDRGGPNNWGEVTKLTASDAAAGARFGSAVSISGDTAIVAAYLASAVGGSSGAAYVFARDEGGLGNWGEVIRLTASDAAPGDLFGWSVALSGGTVVVGAISNDDAGDDSGSAYVFDRDAGGTNNWGEVAKLTASDGFLGDQFGGSVSVNGDNVIVGAMNNDDVGDSSGSAYLFRRDLGGVGNWGEVTKLTALDAASGDLFGTAVSIRADIVLVGARHNAVGCKPGSAYFYSLSCGDGNCSSCESACTCPEDCGLPVATEVPGATCDDGLDNDCDTLADCDDPDCDTDTACFACGDANCDLAEDACSCEIDCGLPDASEVLRATCADGKDNDCDGLTDANDPDCVTDCGNDVCDPEEDSCTCPEDCGPSFTDTEPLDASALLEYADYNPQVATDGLGLWMAVWSGSLDASGFDREILYSWITTDDLQSGLPWSEARPVNTYAADLDDGHDLFPAVATDGQGNWAVVWESAHDVDGTMGSDSDILFSHIATAELLSAVPTWSDALPLNTNASSDGGSGDYAPQLTTDGSAHWIAVWHSRGLAGAIGTDEDILYSSVTQGDVLNGQWTWEPPAALGSYASSDNNNHDDQFAQIATDGMGHWVAAWSSMADPSGTIGKDYDILMAYIDTATFDLTSSSPWSGLAALNTNAASDTGGDFNPQVSADGQGNWVALWTSRDSLGGTIGVDADVLFSRITTDDLLNGLSWMPPTPLHAHAYTDVDPHSDQFAHLVTDGLGNWLAAWTSQVDVGGAIGTDYDLLYSGITTGGLLNDAPWTAPLPLNTSADSDSNGDYYVRLATDGLGNLVAVWQSDDDLGGTIGTDADILVARSECLPAGPCCDGTGTGATTKTFCLDGTSDEVGYAWGLTGPSFSIEELNAPAVPAGSGADALAAAFVDSINSVGCLNKASVQAGAPNCFTVTICGDASFDLTVGPVGNPDGCSVTSPASIDGCSYNPTITEVITSIPTVSEWGLVVMTLLLLVTGTLVYMRRCHHELHGQGRNGFPSEPVSR